MKELMKMYGVIKRRGISQQTDELVDFPKDAISLNQFVSCRKVLNCCQPVKLRLLLL